MPIIKSAKKAARQAEKRTEHNKQIKKDIKAALKAFKTNPTSENLSRAQSEYDKAAKKDLIKKNTASRRKAKLHALAKSMGVKLEKGATGEKKAPVTKATAKKTTTAKKVATKKTESKAKAAKA